MEVRISWNQSSVVDGFKVTTLETKTASDFSVDDLIFYNHAESVAPDLFSKQTFQQVRILEKNEIEIDLGGGQTEIDTQFVIGYLNHSAEYLAFLESENRPIENPIPFTKVVGASALNSIDDLAIIELNQSAPYTITQTTEQSNLIQMNDSRLRFGQEGSWDDNPKKGDQGNFELTFQTESVGDFQFSIKSFIL